MFHASDRTTGSQRAYPHTLKTYVGDQEADVQFQLEVESGPATELSVANTQFLLQRAVRAKHGKSSKRFGDSVFRVVVKPIQQALES